MKFTDVFLARIVAYCNDKGITEREFGLRVANNHKFVSRLRQGHHCSTLQVERVDALIAGEEITPPVSRRPAAAAQQDAA